MDEAANARILLYCAVSLLVSYAIYYLYLHPLARFPGPKVAALSNVWKLHAMASDQMPAKLCRLHEIYQSPVVRIGPNDLHFNHPQAVPTIYKSGWVKGDFYLSFQIAATNLFGEMDSEKHAWLRRMYGPSFSMQSVRTMEPIMDSRYAILRRQLDRFARSGETFNLSHYITYCIVDILGELAFSQPFNNQIDEDPVKIPPVSANLYAACVAGQMPSLSKILILARVFLPFNSGKDMLAARRAIATLASTAIKAREAKSPEHVDILGNIIGTRDEHTGARLTDEEILSQAHTLIVGGTHTTGNTMHLLLANLFRTPKHLKRVVAEIDERLPPLVAGQAACGITGLEEKLDFVNQAILENFRKDPVGTFPMPRTVPAGGANIAGFDVPGGTQVSTEIHALHHNPYLWGPDHNVYDPTRWYDDRAKGLQQHCIPFMVGRRNCVGQNLAMANILKMTTTLLRAYEFDCVNVAEPMMTVCHGDTGLQTPLLVRCKMRGMAFQG